MPFLPHRRLPLPSLRSSLALAGLLAAVSSASAGEGLWADRGDRFEGVITTRNVSGGYFRLVGVHAAGGEASAGAEWLAVSFWLPAPEPRLRVQVWEPGTNYWMVPHRRAYDPGEQRFSWPAGEVLGPLQVAPARLRALVGREDGSVYFPARLAAGGDAEAGYWFQFESRTGLEAEASIWTEAGQEPLWARRVVEDFPGPLRLAWDGRDSAGRPVPAGVLQLRLKGVLYLPQGDEPLGVAVRFQHRQRGP